MTSESEAYKAMLEADGKRRYENRLAARHFVQTNYEHFGLDEAERDDILGALGLTDEVISQNLDWNEAQSLSRGGFRASMGKAVKPRTPPSRGQ